ncbi:PAS domain S-box protein [Flaviaesturariibacter flavus]|uniref:histidine kinase n=1 Tax=Flaviaesturariibacter flavus TaxID=2502780 RepID=A0A4R1B590_9BACT|nr:PAS domain S-box protein [Flaviaesturariibacter flavus]TCJ12660.1 PAS domain S-box protein [Flaviaesturariibacter flavus]
MLPLKTSDFDISSFFERTPDLVCIAGRDGYFKKVNNAVAAKLEYSEEELFSQPIATFIHPDDRERTGAKREKLLAGETLTNFQNRYLAKSGKVVWLQWTSVYFPEQEVVFAIAKDITEKKILEQEMEERYKEFESLARYFKQTMERDRKYVAVELHEELAQLASLIKMNTDWLSSWQDELPESARARMAHISSLTERMIHTIREIAFSFSPAMLEDLGLKETLAVLCREFSTLKGIRCSLHCRLEPGLLTQEASLDFFRICQEVLGAIERGSPVDEVSIRVEKEQDSARLQITGRASHEGALPDAYIPALADVRQRVAYMNGRVSLAREGDRGWQLTVLLPLVQPTL